MSTANIFRLDTAGVAIVCLIYMDVSSPAHMRYSCLGDGRRELPKATIVLGCWLKDMDPAALKLGTGRRQSRPCCREFLGRGGQTMYLVRQAQKIIRT